MFANQRDVCARWISSSIAAATTRRFHPQRMSRSAVRAPRGVQGCEVGCALLKAHCTTVARYGRGAFTAIAIATGCQSQSTGECPGPEWEIELAAAALETRPISRIASSFSIPEMCVSNAPLWC